MAPIVAALIPGLTSSLLDMGKELIHSLFPDPIGQAKERAEAFQKLEELAAKERMETRAQDVSLALAQIQVNIEDAKSGNFWQSGWRPAVGWSAVGGLTYQVMFRPVAGWIMENWLAWNMPPNLELETLMTLLFGVLGLGGYRTWEKLKDKANEKV